MKTVLITGAAQGIGLATARHYAALGWFVGIYDVNRSGIEELLASGDFAHACGDYCDVTDYASVQSMITHFAEHAGGKLDLLVNNAGVLSIGHFVDIDNQSHDQIIDVNVRGATNTLQAAFTLLRATPGAAAVNLCSASSIHGVPELAVYSASKFYIDGLTEALHLEWRDHDIHVTCVKPPVINTAMGKAVSAHMPQKLAKELDAADVAALIQRAAEGHGTSFPMGAGVMLWYLLDKFLPNGLRHRLARYLTAQ
ncbi:SDR family NAD(P)-dependent oxidoreductase [Pseudohalioglobus lutimaris]|uniref:SDR family NAD(P)-dependent oxidoreductase n=1 Tax=Pseudohalioglobus lutimaris TaxID=1737061 RepID=UPI00096B904E|nr:SDR family NAD(P)-dependent oxidoreductase [Pseudohalioglobus lutimaris]